MANKEYKVEIDGVACGMDILSYAKIHQPLFDTFSVGCACSAELVLTFYPNVEPPRNARIVAYAREGAEAEWEQLGVFYISIRENENTSQTLEAYDAMLRCDQPFMEEGDVGEWPRPAPDVVAEISERTGIPIDERTELDPSIMVEYVNDYTMREILGHIGAAHAGNWIITAQETLLLVPLFSSMPEPTHCLINEDGYYIVFGNVRLLV